MALREQQELIRAYNEERKGHERRFHKLTAVTKAASQSPDLFGRTNMKDLPPTPPPLDVEPKEDESRGRARMWLNDQSKEAAGKMPDNATSFLRDISPKTRLPGDPAQTLHSRRMKDITISDETSLLDMTTFLKTDPPQNEDAKGKDSTQHRRKFRRPRYKQQARDPIVRGNNSELINFFRERSPPADGEEKEVVMDSQSPKSSVPQHIPIQVSGDPEPPAGIEAESEQGLPVTRPEVVNKLLYPKPAIEKRPLSPAMLSPSKQFNVHSPDAPAPLRSNPPSAEPPSVKIDIARPGKTSWPQPAVISWLEENSFSAEWQSTFRKLNIHGAEFVALESGSSIRKMLTVIYPQLAKQCSDSGKGWDQSRERAEGFRLRKLLREMPVGDKYEGETSNEEKPKKEYDAIRPASPTSATSATGLARSLPVSRGRRPAIISHTKNNSQAKASAPIPEEQTYVGHDTHFRDVSPLREDDERRIEKAQKAHAEAQARSAAARTNAHAAMMMHGADAAAHCRNEPGSAQISDEWVRKWTVLSSAEIARGRSRELAPSLMV